ncbi:TonB-dependent receptor [Dysgonomonas sp. Marseille-P4677]|uniref:SusC/RagA family TonB-linked outer membrane protein n=1 Tax=Dysgonomonas sp. Marseille-P4677 TaxID=2364790 RepID=UPI001912D609|nr:TonB-dependent receptor [Dysgonomonas sp. Marseille-P4677]MBK5720640.1 TonB-dependent receptor [Dysgonomonas sp. Marseille-P4677]
MKIKNLLYHVIPYWMMLVGLLMYPSLQAYAQVDRSASVIVVKGNVTDEHGETLIGVSVSVKGQSTLATITNENGDYTLRNVPSNGIIVFSYIGMVSMEVNVSGKEVIDVRMSDQSIGLEQVVVTAFATQKKINVTGAISTVTGREITSTPVSNVANALIGNTPGVGGLQTSGEPGRNAANIRIRGIATYGDATPLIVIDGVEQSAEQAFAELNAMDPNEILGVSVLKDASSTAVYGIRSANGVIIVTTKRGMLGKPVISLSANYGFTKASNLQQNLSSYDWAVMRNDAIDHENKSYAGATSNNIYKYNENHLWKFRNNRDFTSDEIDGMNLSPAQREMLLNSPSLFYGSQDLYGNQFGESGPQAQLNLNISGGTETLKYFASLGYFTQEGITNTTNYYGSNTGSKFERYNFRSNFDIDITKNLKISVGLAGQFGSTQGPGNTSDPYDLSARYKAIMQYVYEGNPFMAPGIIDGKLISGFAGEAGTIQNPISQITNSQIGNQNAIYNLLNSGTGTIDNTLLNATVKVEHELDYLLKNLKVQGTVNYQDNYNRITSFRPSLPSYTVQRNLEDPNVLEFFGGSIGQDEFSSWGHSNWNKLYVDGGLSWAQNFGLHHVSGLFLGKASKYYMPWDSNNTNTPSGVIGLVGRVTYNYDECYMAELNIGYNGTEQFRKGKRFGFFPAYSVGWVPSSESFFPKNKWVTFAKVRGSYGEVGNDRLGNQRRYLYLPNTYNLNQSGYWWGNTGNNVGNYYLGVTEGTLGNPNVTWEKAQKYDIGVELKFLDNRLSFIYDWFKEDRKDILTTLGTILDIYGVDSGKVPPSNIGQTTNKGYEIGLGWNDQIGHVGYSVEANMSHTKNKIIYQAEAPNPYYWMNRTGFSIGQRFGLKSDGLFNTQEELANRPYNTFTSNKATLGDIRYVDLNGDGIIDNKDIAPIEYPNYPAYHYSIKLGVNYKGFDIKLLFNGTARGSFYMGSGMTMPFFKYAGNAWQWMDDGRWTEERYAAGSKITYPRSIFNPTTSENNYLSQSSDYWMYSNDFFKLKNMEIGYTFPSNSKFLKMARLASLRLYINGNNLITFQNEMRKMGIDPETADGSSYIYPLTRVFNFGLNIQF